MEDYFTLSCISWKNTLHLLITINILMVLIFTVYLVNVNGSYCLGHFNFLRLIKSNHRQWKKLYWSSPNTILEKIITRIKTAMSPAAEAEILVMILLLKVISSFLRSRKMII